MRQVYKKVMRDNMDVHIRRTMKEIYPHFEMDINSMRVPAFPKIVLYSNVPIDNFLAEYDFFTKVACSPSISLSHPHHPIKVMKLLPGILLLSWCLTRISSSMELLSMGSLSTSTRLCSLIVSLGVLTWQFI